MAVAGMALSSYSCDKNEDQQPAEKKVEKVSYEGKIDISADLTKFGTIKLVNSAGKDIFTFSESAMTYDLKLEYKTFPTKETLYLTIARNTYTAEEGKKYTLTINGTTVAYYVYSNNEREKGFASSVDKIDFTAGNQKGVDAVLERFPVTFLTININSEGKIVSGE